MVVEFYANMSDSILDEESPLHHKVYVRGFWVDSPSAISLGCPDIESDYTPELERPHISPSFLVSFFTKRLVETWSDNNITHPSLKSELTVCTPTQALQVSVDTICTSLELQL